MKRSEVFYHVKEIVLEQLFPYTCPFCGKIISYEDGCCSKCSELLLPQTSVCLKCGKRECICDRLKYVDRMYAPFLYEGIVKNAVWQMKFVRHPNYAKNMAKLIAEHSEYIFSDDSAVFDYILYVPMDRARYRQRSYNPSELIALELGRILHIPVIKNGIRKMVSTSAQHDLDFVERQKNLQKAFAAGKANFRGKRVLLCDDVITTGATMEYCAKSLKEADAAYVFGIAFASTDKKL